MIFSGFLIHNSSTSTDKTMVTIPYIIIGVGCVVFGHFMGNIIKYYSIRSNKDLKCQIEIDMNDERNVVIAEQSKAKAYYLIIYLFAAMLIIFAIMGVDKFVIIRVVVIYLALQMYSSYWRFMYEKRM